MSAEILKDARLRKVSWKDLTELNRLEVMFELLLSAPWLLGSLLLAYYGFYFFALGVSFIFFLTGLRQVHNAYHYALGISRQSCEWVMFVLSIVMLGSMHAIQWNHLRHHAHCMSEDDVEAMSAQLPGWKALLVGPLFPIRLIRAALKGARGRQLQWIRAELIANFVVILLIVWVLPSPFLLFHLAAMAIGNCLTAFFAVWTVHHDCDRSHFIARTMRSRVLNAVTFNMFFHVEHHLFPKVPTCHLPRLAKRLDEVAPELRRMRVL
jgi:fatty acid desaturase